MKQVSPFNTIDAAADVQPKRNTSTIVDQLMYGRGVSSEINLENHNSNG